MANPYNETPADTIAELLYGPAPQAAQQQPQQIQQPASVVGSQMAPPVNPARTQPLPQAPQPNAANVANTVNQTMSTLRSGTPEPQASFAGKDLVNQIVDNWMLPIGVVATYALSQTEPGQKAIKSLKDRFIGGGQTPAQQPIQQRIEPSFTPDPAPPQAAPAPSVPAGSISGDPEGLQRGLLGKGGPVENPSSQNAPVPPSTKDLILEEKLKRERLATQHLQAKIDAEAKQTQMTGPATGTTSATGTTEPTVTRVVNSAPAPDIGAITQDRNQRAAELIEANRQAGLGVNKASPTATPDIAPTIATTPNATPVVTGEAGPAVAPKTRAPRRTPEQMAAARAESAGKGPYNWLNSQFGKDEAVTQDFIKKYLGGKAPETMDEAYQVLEKTLGGPKKSDFLKAQKGELTARQMEIGPVKPPENLIKAKAKELTGQKGNISLGQSLNLLGNALGVAGLAQSYKEAKKTGDWSEFGMGAVGQVLGNVAPKAGLAFSLMAPGSLNTGEEEALQDIQYRAKVGSGRGIAPPSAYQR